MPIEQPQHHHDNAIARVTAPPCAYVAGLDQPKEGRLIMSFDWQDSELLSPFPPASPPGFLSERQGTVEFKRRSSLLMTHRARLLRFQAAPRLTRDEELEALEHFRASHGVVRCPPAFGAPSQAFIG